MNIFRPLNDSKKFRLLKFNCSSRFFYEFSCCVKHFPVSVKTSIQSTSKHSLSCSIYDIVRARSLISQVLRMDRKNSWDHYKLSEVAQFLFAIIKTSGCLARSSSLR